MAADTEMFSQLQAAFIAEAIHRSTTDRLFNFIAHDDDTYAARVLELSRDGRVTYYVNPNLKKLRVWL